MKVLMLVVYGMPPVDLFTNEILVNIRQLMAIGAYGEVEQPEQFSNPGDPKQLEVDTWDAFAESGKRCLRLSGSFDKKAPSSTGEILETRWEAGDIHSLSRQQFEQVLAWIKGDDWGACLIEDHGLRFANTEEIRSSYIRNLDQWLGLLFEFLDDETVVSILFRPETLLSRFILAAPFVDPAGEVKGVETNDVAATLMHLCGLVRGEIDPEKLILKRKGSLDERTRDLSEDEESILRERLSGLGYF